MNKITKALLSIAVLGFTTLSVQAVPYNHIDHNDPYYTFALGSIETLDCGNSTLAACITPINIEAFAASRCKAIINAGGLPAYGDPYWHSVKQYATRVVSAIDGNSGVGPLDYSVDVIFSCDGLLHPGIRMLPG